MGIHKNMKMSFMKRRNSILDSKKITLIGLTRVDDAVEVVTEEAKEFADESAYVDNASDVRIKYDHVEVETVEIPVITDVHGRLSDAIEAMEKDTGLSVIPLKMANIAPEVESLQRHEIFEFMGERFAMSKKLREEVITEWTQKIIANLSTGLPFEENLVTSITYNNRPYTTIALSRIEWTLLLSKFRSYKQDLFIRHNNSIVMTVLAEKVE